MFVKLDDSFKEMKDKCKRTYKLGIRQRLIHEVAFPITWLFLHTKITPNQVTLLWGAIQFFSCFLFLKGNYLGILLALTIYQFAIFLDAVDGHIARYRKIQSFTGLFFDQIMHYITIPLMFVCLSIGVAKQHGSIAWLIVGFAATIIYVYTKLLTFNPFIYGISNVKDVVDILDSPDYSLRYSKNKFAVALFEWFRIEHPFNILFFTVLFNISHIGLVVHFLVFSAELLRKVYSQVRQLNKVDKKLRYESH
ncbi:MAG: CDP-alcohol phosphatidyltransferase family protein [Nanoarchaeota archaeon]|nr:CDP-alcohol phosphatidyltransferase family protein [Nanoarchaeota archaeon]MBU1704621.1 CDP-alcohol phosphatidyltransferase family protein [Nanoarchaeota archaeon]